MFTDSDTHALLDLYGDSPARYKILLAFISHPCNRFDLTELAEQAGIGTSTVHRHKDFLNYYIETGLLTRETTDAGVDKYRLNTDSEFAQIAAEWFRMNEQARQVHESGTEEDTALEFYK